MRRCLDDRFARPVKRRVHQDRYTGLAVECLENVPNAAATRVDRLNARRTVDMGDRRQIRASDGGGEQHIGRRHRTAVEPVRRLLRQNDRREGPNQAMILSPTRSAAAAAAGSSGWLQTIPDAVSNAASTALSPYGIPKYGDGDVVSVRRGCSKRL